MDNQRISTHPSLSSKKNNSEVYRRQMALAQKYNQDPTTAQITDSSEVIGVSLHDPFRTSVSINEKMQVPLKIGVHKAVGGDHDSPNPGDILCAALAACFESTLRLISNRLEIKLTKTRVKATATVDVRGTLMIDTSVPVGFQSMHVEVVLVAHDSDEKTLQMLIGATKRSCIIYQTLKNAIPISFNASIEAKTK